MKGHRARAECERMGRRTGLPSCRADIYKVGMIGWKETEERQNDLRFKP
jgi:hypothetical protein